MPLILTPSTNPKIKKTIVEFFKAKPLVGVRFWPCSFLAYLDAPVLANNAFKAKIRNRTNLYIITAGYGELSVEYAIREYIRLLLKTDPKPRIYFINVCLPTKQSGLDLGDLVIPRSAAGGITAKLYRKKGKKVSFFDKELTDVLIKFAHNLKLNPHTGRLFSPNDGAEFDWPVFYEEYGHKHGYIALEHESALVAAMGEYYNIPTAALLCVKDVGKPDSRYLIKSRKRRTGYKVIDLNSRLRVLTSQLELIKLSLGGG